MKLAYSSRFVPLLSCGSRVRVLFFSTETLISPSFDSLYKRVEPIIDPMASIVPVLDKWIDEGKKVNREELQSLIFRMRTYKRFQHALEISHWMSDRRYFKLSPSDVAVRLDLLCKVRGLEHAEEYFNSIPKQLKSLKPYGSLLNCYVKEKSVEKADALMQEMKKMGFAKSFAYNLLVNLYCQIGQPENIDILMGEMEEKGIPRDKFTLINRLSAYVVASDVGGMENILNRMEEDPVIVVDWNWYAVAANGYLKVGLIDKALAMLKKVEEMTINRSTKAALCHLLTLYASAGRKNELYRIWNFYKSAGRVQNTSYMSMITSLAKVNDIEGAEKIFEEWESSCTSFDFRVLNRLIVSYCKKGLLDKAESVVKKAVEKAEESGRAPYASTWNILAVGYLEDKQMLKVVEMSKKAMLVGRRGWKQSPVIVAACLEYFEGQGDVEGAEDFVKLLGTSGPLTRQVYHGLLRTYIAAHKPVSNVLSRMEVDCLPVDEETHKILERRIDI